MEEMRVRGGGMNLGCELGLIFLLETSQTILLVLQLLEALLLPLVPLVLVAHLCKLKINELN
jgi:hypothetical protein